MAVGTAQSLGCSAADGAQTEAQDQSSRRDWNLSRPADGLSSAELARFQSGLEEFSAVETVEDGIGPVFNDVSCANCHTDGGVGGGSKRLETRFGRLDNSGNFDALSAQGGSLMQDHGIGRVKNRNGSVCAVFNAEVPPQNANVVASRRTTPLFGLGLVDATPAAVFQNIANSQPASMRGRVNLVTNPDNGQTVVGKFGWKAQVPTLHAFAGDAYLNEMGITSPSFPNESCPQGNCDSLRCNPAPDINDDGDDVDLFADFMQLLGAPSRARVSRDSERDVSSGERIFNDTGCATCHVETLSSGPSAVRALSQKTYHPFSDFLLHDMGRAGDGIGGQGRAAPREMRTAPLWGLRAVVIFMHDGRSTSIEAAIDAHDGQGAGARDRFRNLGRTQRSQLVSFLRSL
jgi:CxxC motif-containing protein (DUF1111 family)